MLYSKFRIYILILAICHISLFMELHVHVQCTFSLAALQLDIVRTDTVHMYIYQ